MTINLRLLILQLEWKLPPGVGEMYIKELKENRSKVVFRKTSFYSPPSLKVRCIFVKVVLDDEFH